MTTVDLLETVVTIDDRMGLHARPATMLAKLCSGFNARLTLERLDGDGEKADCSSALALLMLEAKSGTRLRLTAAGDDAKKAFSQVVHLFESRFGEREIS